MKKKIVSILTIVSIILSFCACGNTAGYDIEGDINYIKDIFSCVTIDGLLQNYSTEISSPDDLEFNGTFANIEGTYKIELYEEGDNDIHAAGEIYSVTFSWDDNLDIPLDDIAAAMRAYLGEEDFVDEEGDFYVWHGKDITKFSNAPFGNCFDIQIFDFDSCIVFGLSTTANTEENYIESAVDTSTDESVEEEPKDEIIDANEGVNSVTERDFVNGNCFTYTARSFMERFDDADKNIDGYNYAYMRANGEENLIYELVDIDGGYENVKNVGMVSFANVDGDMLVIDDDNAESAINSITFLLEDIEDVPVVLVCGMCAADLSLDFMAAWNVADSIVKDAENPEGYTYNGINYSIVTDGEYYYIKVSLESGDSSINTTSVDDMATTSYTLNFAEFSVPDSYYQKSTDGNLMVFEGADNENDRIMVEIEDVPDIMKVDAGDGAILTANDTAEFYIFNIEDETIKEGWVKFGTLDCYEKYFLLDSDTGTRYGRSIVIPINQNERVITIHSLCDVEDDLAYVDVIINSILIK